MSARGIAMIGVFLSLFLASLNQTMVSTSMPRIVASLGGMELYSWVFTAYMLASTVSVPIYGKLSDLLGRRPILLFGLALFAVASLLAGFAGSMAQLIGIRVLQGLGAGAVMPIAFAIVGDLYEPHERGRIQGLIGASFGIASLSGPLVGGWLTDHWGWHWTFLANVPIAVLALAVVAFVLPKRQRGHGALSIDALGAAFLVLSLTPFLGWASLGGHAFPWLSAPSMGLLALAVGFGAGFFWQERRAPDPIIHLGLFRNDVFSIAAITTLLGGMVMFGATMFIPLYAQGVLGASATASGAVTTPMTLALVSASAVSGNLASRLGRYRWLCLGGSAFLVLGVFVLSRPELSGHMLGLGLGMVVLGLGLGFTMPLLTLAVQNAVPPAQLGSVTSLVQFFRSIGGTLGVALFGALMAAASRAGVLSRLPDVPAERLPDPQVLLAPGAAERLSAPLVSALRAALGGAIHQVFVVALGVALAALAFNFFLRDLPLARRQHGALQEAGEELAAENPLLPGMIREEDQPDLLDRLPGERPART